jgi:hypothetical protein
MNFVKVQVQFRIRSRIHNLEFRIRFRILQKVSDPCGSGSTTLVGISYFSTLIRTPRILSQISAQQ